MRLLCSIIRILISHVDRLRNHFPMRGRVAPQFVRHDLPRFLTMASQWPLEKTHCIITITLGLKIHIYCIATLIDCPPKVMLLAIDLHKYFVNVEVSP
jgi:hypothetical protein